ncbi:MAG: alkaline phosphatase [Bacteroidaceae bacterium]|nr:alkaline phosphatase [Bacteroidaceae bacterium]
MKKRILSVLALLVVALTLVAQQRAKYVFYFIGDGMGVNQVNAAETYLGALEGRIGTSPMCFPSFPYSALVNTQSATNGVTDSAAGGTALATGKKTKNSTIGMNTERTAPIYSVAQWAHDAGAAVGVTTSVSVDHATPSAFYAHVPDRNQYHDIGKQLCASGFDFFAGSDFLKPEGGEKTLYQQAEDAGYTIARGYKDYQKRSKKADKMILFQSEAASRVERNAIPCALDRTKNDLTLTDITRAAIHFLTKCQAQKDGFFLMVEGGKIDWLCHANDLAFIPEVLDMDDAVRVAYEFYQQHPDETLIVVTADHETGGLALGRGPYELNLAAERGQRLTIGQLGRELHALHEKYGAKYDWNVVKQFLTDRMGFWKEVNLNDDQTKRVERAFKHVMEGKGTDTQTLYQRDDELANTVKHIISECCMCGWVSGGHSNGYVPAFAIGVGAEEFHGRMDNTQIAPAIARAAGWQQR